ncbi:MAG: hypothetical protein U0176_05805 [Bacteroidia bacterium]
MTRFLRIAAFVLGVALLLPACKESAGSSKKRRTKWLPYVEQAALDENALRARLHVMSREAKTNAPSDTGIVWFPSETILYNAYGQPTMAQEFDQTGAMVKETRSDYQDSLLVRQAVNEKSGYSSAIHTTYNAAKLKVSELLFQRGDSIMRREYKVDDLGNELEVSLIRYRDSSRYKLVTERDDLGRPVNVKEMQGEKTNWTETYEISDTLWRILRKETSGKLQSDYEMRFDKEGRITRMVNRNPDGKARIQVDYTYDAKGHPLTESYIGGNGQPMQTMEFSYDDKGLITERRLIVPNQPFVLTTRYTYIFRK